MRVLGVRQQGMRAVSLALLGLGSLVQGFVLPR